MILSIENKPIFISPFKNPGKENIPPGSTKSAKVARRLFADVLTGTADKMETAQIKPESTEVKEKKEATYESISCTYSFDFVTLSKQANSAQFLALREQVLKIEKFLDANPVSDINFIRQKIKALLKCLDFDTKMSELGMILFYLDRNNQLPFCEYSLVYFRAQEIKKEVEEYTAIHTKKCKNPLIPSGKTHYLMRAFAHMLFTSSQIYNKGALIALKQLLLNPDHEISKYLQPEHREHILIIVEQILTHAGFENLFGKKIEIHPSLKDAIRIDLKMAPNEEVISVHVLWDCMMAFFSDIRQADNPNCYAISALIYVTENHTLIAFERLIQWLEKGFHAFNEKIRIPILPLLEKRLVNSKDLNIVPETDKALELAPFTHIFETLSLVNKTVEAEAIPLSQTFETIVHANKASQYLPHAEKLYYAFKHNTLIHLQLALFEFIYINSHIAESFLKSPYSDFKQDFINECVASLEHFIKKRFPVCEHFRAKLKQLMGEKLWLENCGETNVIIKEGKTLIAGSQNYSSFKGNLEALASVLRCGLKIFFLNAGTYIQLQSISDLQKAIEALIQETYAELVQRNIACKESQKHFTLAVHSFDFRVDISHLLSQKMIKQKLSGKHLNDSDILIFEQQGGDERAVLDLVYKISISRHYVEDCHSPYQFLANLLEKIKSFDLSVFKETRKVILATQKHAWTLSAFCWKFLLENQHDFHSFVQNNIFIPAKRKLNQWVPTEVLNRVIETFSDEESIRERMRSFFHKIPDLTYGKFKQLLLTKTDVEDVAWMKKVIETEFSKITLNKTDLLWTLKELKLDVSQAFVEKLIQQLKKEAAFPYQWAKHIRTLLIEEKIAIFDPYEIEIALCKVLKLPLSINVGDLNYIDKDREDPSHVYLIIAFSWLNAIPCYFIREENNQYAEDFKKYHSFQVQFPTSNQAFPNSNQTLAKKSFIN